MQSFLALVTPIGAHGLGDLRPDQGLPQPPMYPTTGPIYGGGHPSTGPIYGGGHPSQGLPWGPGHPSQGLPGYGHPDQGLPGGGGHPSQGLPGSGGGTLPVWNPIYGWFLMQIREQTPHPDAGLPGGENDESAQPK